MVTGKTGEKIITPGNYMCQDHNDNKVLLKKDDTFPICSKENNHSTIWQLVEEKEKQKTESSGDAPRTPPDNESNGNTNTSNSTHNSNTETKITVKLDYVKPIKISEIILDAKLIKKKGFLLSVDGNGSAQSLLNAEMEKIEAQYKKLKDDYINFEDERIVQLKELIARYKDAIEELDAKKSHYETRIKTEIPVEKEELENKIEELNKEIYQTLREIGKQKEDIVGLSIIQLKENLKKGIAVNREIQDEQNVALDKLHQEDKKADEKKISFWSDILTKYTEAYNKVTDRLKFLSKDGINNQTSSFLLFLGSVAALVSGWWFSLWTGPAATDSTNVGGNTSVKLFFLDNIGKFLTSYSLQAIILGLFAYLVIVGTLSWICYKLSVRFGFIIPKKHKKSKKQKQNEEEPEEMEIDINDEEELINARFKANNWFALWLKIAPFLLAVIPLLAIISKQVKTDIQVPNGTNFQSLFDSIVNQFIGTCIAISFSTFTILFFSRITENKYHDEIEAKKKNGLVFYFCFGVFFLMILSMFLYHTKGLIEDVRTIAIIGFLVSCIATGFSLGYGYLFRSLHESSESLLVRIDIISTIIRKYSRPYRVNYTTNASLRFRIYQMQQRIFDVISERHDLAVAIAGGYDIKEFTPTPTPPSTPINNATYDTKREKKQKNKNKKGSNIFSQFFAFLRQENKKEKEKKIKEENKHAISHNISKVELKYFSEKAEQLNEFNKRIKALNSELEKLIAEENDYWRNMGTYQSINDQIKNAEQQKLQAENMLAKTQGTIAVETKLIEDKREEEKTLIKEGYITGLWFKEMNNGKNDKLLTI